MLLSWLLAAEALRSRRSSRSGFEALSLIKARREKAARGECRQLLIPLATRTKAKWFQNLGLEAVGERDLESVLLLPKTAAL